MTEVIFGRGQRARLATAFEPETRVVVLATPGRVGDLDQTLATWPPRWTEVARFTEIGQHVPRATLEAAAQLVRTDGARGVVAFGGGSPIGVAKALAIDFDLRKVYVPTTFSGSEMTNIWAVSDDGEKTTARDERVRADLVIYDADLVDSMPLSLVYVSLFNAMAHAVEALYAPDVTSAVRDDAASAAALLCTAIDTLAQRDEPTARETALRGARHAGRALDAAQMGLHHKLAHVLGGSLGLEHSKVHTVILPYSIAYNREYASEAIDTLTQSLGAEPVQCIVELQRRAGLPSSLRELGMDEVDIPRVVAELQTRPYPNPRPLEPQALEQLVRAAWAGELRDQSERP